MRPDFMMSYDEVWKEKRDTARNVAGQVIAYAIIFTPLLFL